MRIFSVCGIMNKKHSGFSKDAITSDVTKLVGLSDGNFDSYIYHTRKMAIALAQEGDKILPVRKGVKGATFLHVHLGMFIESYTFWTDTDR